MRGNAIRETIEREFGALTAPIENLYGGDINEVYLLHTSSGPLVIKTNTTPLPGMFPAEADALKALKNAGGFRVPEVLGFSEDHLALEYIEPGNTRDVGAEDLGLALACLHKNTSPHYGWNSNNYIGSLPQKNTQHRDAVSFYRDERLLPQFKLARERGFKFRNLEAFLQNLDHLIPEEPASLIHGDLWSGNYMVSKQGEPCLIDPAIAYASREMDLSMMALFGGFPKDHIPAYQEAYPLQPDWKERIPLWQLYYILVHLNLFGAGYYARCVQIIKGFV